MRLIFLFFAVPLLEVALFVWIGGAVGAPLTVSWVILAFVLGMLMLRSLGMNISNAVQGAFSGGANPGRAMAETGLLLIAAILFIIPGFLSDAIAILLLPAPVRRFLIARFVGRVGISTSSSAATSVILDADYEVVAESEPVTSRETIQRMR